MSFERFIAQRFMPRRGDGGGFSGPLSGIAVAGIALGVAVMVMAVSILRGFQGEIASKVSGFGSHITVSAYGSGADYQESPIAVDSVLVARLRRTPGVRHVQPTATKGGMVKTTDQIHGILLHGISDGHDTAFFAASLVAGRLPRLDGEAASSEVAISSAVASKLRLSLGDKMRTYFWQDNQPRARAFTVCGIYNTDLSEMDNLYVLGDLRQVQRLNGWLPADSTLAPVGALEVLVDRFDDLDAVALRLAEQLPYDLTLRTVREANPALFSWLGLLDSSVALMLVLMCVVCAVTIVSALLIMIFEKSATIGILKTLGATDRSIRRIFLLKAGRLVAMGIAAGDLLALALALAQRRWGLVRLDPESYSMSLMPVDLNGATFALVSLGAAAACLLAVLLPLAGTSRIEPAKTIRTE